MSQTVKHSRALDAQLVDKLSEQVVYLFEEFFKKASKRKNFTLDLDLQRQDVVLLNFIKRLNKAYSLPSVGSNTLLSYFVYQFQYWHDKKTKRPLTLSWIIGKKAFLRWQARPDYHFLFSRSGILKDWDINLRTLYLRLEKKEAMRNPVEQSYAERVEKLRFFNTERGLANCLDYTTLYVKSYPCNVCNHASACKTALSTNYPELSRQRLSSIQDLSQFRPL
jgi:hypothetical protein